MELRKALIEIPGVYDVDIAFDGFGLEAMGSVIRITVYCSFPAHKEEAQKQRQDLADVTERIRSETGHKTELTVCHVRSGIEHAIGIWK